MKKLQVQTVHLVSACEMVEQFWRAFRLPIAENHIDSTVEGRLLAANLIDEEFMELTMAENDAETLDAYADLLYVTLGGVLAAGHRPKTAFKNLPTNMPVLSSAVSLARYYLNKHPYCLAECTYHTPVAAATVFAYATGGYEKFLAYFEAVHGANMSKLWKADEIGRADKTMTVSPSAETNLFIVKRAADGKLLKSPSFTHPDPSKYL